MNAKGYIVVIVIAVALGAWLWMKPAAAPATPEDGTPIAETMPAPEADELNALDIQDANFAEIDVDAQAL